MKPKSPRARQAAVWASKIADPAARDRFIELLAEASALSQRAAELRRHAWTLYRSAPPADTPSTNRTPTNA